MASFRSACGTSSTSRWAGGANVRASPGFRVLPFDRSQIRRDASRSNGSASAATLDVARGRGETCRRTET